MDVAIPKTFEAFVRRKVEEGFNLVDDAVGVRRCAGRVERQVLSPQVGFERPCTRGSDAFDMCGDVVLTLDVPEHGVCAGDIGTALERHVVPGVSEEGYSVEFFDMAGNTVAVATLPASALRQPTAADRPAGNCLPEP
jgi:hypothetical protein